MNNTNYSIVLPKFEDINLNGIIEKVLKDYVTEHSWLIWFIFLICIDALLFLCICTFLYREIQRNRKKASQIIQILETQPSAPPWPESD